jgi:NAD+ kinase
MNGDSSATTDAVWRKSTAPPRALLFAEGHPSLTAALLDSVRAQLASHCQILPAEFGDAGILAGADADFAVVLGGDGAILRAASRLGSHQLPILAVNIGRLGFLANVPPAQFPDVIENVAAGQCRVVSHLMFQCRIERNDVVILDQLGLNETAVLAGPPFSILEVDLLIDGELATTYSCDGLLISTPVGSTAHSLSAGGPILQKSLGAFVICPISPHTLTVRPLVDSADFIYEMRVREPNQATSVVVDGQTVHQLLAGDRVIVQRAAPRFQLIEVPGHSYYRTLREKLGWAGQIRRK